MSIQQYRCKKHPKYTRRASHPDGVYEEGEWKGKIKYKYCIPKCPICREKMEIYSNKEKGNKYNAGVYRSIDENFNKSLKSNYQKDKKIKIK